MSHCGAALPPETTRVGQGKTGSDDRRRLQCPASRRAASDFAEPCSHGRASGHDRGAARSDRPLRRSSRARSGRHGSRLPGPRSPARPARRHQDRSPRPRTRAGGRRRPEEARPSGGHRRRAPHPPQHRRHPRRPRAGRDPVHRDGVRGRPDPRGADRRRRGPALIAGRAPGDRSVRRPGVRARSRRGPPRHQAEQHPRDGRGRREGRRLRDRPGRRQPRHADRGDPGDSRLHVAGAASGTGARRAKRHLRARGDALRGPHRRPAVPGRRSRGTPLPDRPPGAGAAVRAAPRRAAGPGAGDRAGDGQEPGGALRHGRRVRPCPHPCDGGGGDGSPARSPARSRRRRRRGRLVALACLAIAGAGGWAAWARWAPDSRWSPRERRCRWRRSPSRRP